MTDSVYERQRYIIQVRDRDARDPDKWRDAARAAVRSVAEGYAHRLLRLAHVADVRIVDREKDIPE